MSIPVGRGRGRGRGLAFRTQEDLKPGLQTKITPSVAPEAKSTINGATPKAAPPPVTPESKPNSEAPAKPAASQTKPNPNNEINCVKNILSMMSMMTDEDVLEHIPGQFKYFKTEEGFNEFMRQLMDKCFREPDFATTAAQLCNKLWNDTNLQGIFKKPLLSTAQQNYAKRGELRKKRNDDFYGLCVFLCEIYKHIKAKGQRLGPLLPFVCEILKELISCSDRETSCDDALYFHQEMESIGKIIQEANKKELEEIMNAARLKVISGDLLPSVRCRMIQVIELSASGWKLDSEVDSFYEDLQQDLVAAGK